MILNEKKQLTSEMGGYFGVLYTLESFFWATLVVFGGF